MTILIVGVQAYRSGFLPSEFGHDADEIEVDDSGATLFEELASLDSRITTAATQAASASAQIDCKWVGKTASYDAQASSIVVDCPSTHPVLVSGGGSCYNENPQCDITGQKVKTSKPYFRSSGTPLGFVNSWEITCDKPAKSTCRLPAAYAFCCSTRLRTNLPAVTLP